MNGNAAGALGPGAGTKAVALDPAVGNWLTVGKLKTP